MHDVKDDLYQAFSKYSMDLKYCISKIENKKSVLQTPRRESGEIESLLGLNWNIVTDTIQSTPVYNLFGQSRRRF